MILKSLKNSVKVVSLESFQVSNDTVIVNSLKLQLLLLLLPVHKDSITTTGYTARIHTGENLGFASPTPKIWTCCHDFSNAQNQMNYECI